MNINNDFETFANEIAWFIQPSDKVFITKNNEELETSQEFKDLFPTLSILIEKARKTVATINDQKYTLFAWDDLEGVKCGWFCKMEDEASFPNELISEHKMLLANIGGIQESFNDFEEFSETELFTDNQNFLFIGSECKKGLDGWNDYYSESCEEEGLKEIDYSNMVSFVNEANGTLTMYDTTTKEVLLFSHDHCFDNVICLENQPEYTFHTFKGVDNFVDYVEELAQQWTNHIK
ncbi:hypothetical protein ATE84_2896 [Aquimarina sp. MAR_2010_214]|uniref:hypothetical protein n=1 Tax=Aquimarina sp. MAR_2010_214 TaxID=1250026 RepID=UPI000C7110A5|nr:hypothetical protein [Aquimarina sp. MAR_2010_214]PKV50829.1 hypothetical protein ATE84_2896 [Aquimarina sp. MAR_2010_214]